MRRRFLITANVTAGRGQTAHLDAVIRALKSTGAEVELVRPPSPDAAEQIVSEACRRGQVDAVLAAGGDGSIRRAATGASGSGVPVGIIPLGTGNVMAGEIGMPRRAEEIARVLMTGPATRIEGAMVNGRPFFLWVGAGFDGRVVRVLHLGAKRRLGKLAYGAAIARSILDPLDELTVSIDGVTRRAAWAIVSNASRYGGHFTLTDQTRLGEPGLVALLMTEPSRALLIRMFMALATGRLPALARSARGLCCLPARDVIIEGRDKFAVQIDGDPETCARLAISTGGPAFHLIRPDARPTAT